MITKTCKDFNIELCNGCRHGQCNIPYWEVEFKTQRPDFLLNFFYQYPKYQSFWEVILSLYAPDLLGKFRDQCLLLNFI